MIKNVLFRQDGIHYDKTTYCGTSLRRIPLGPTKSSIIERVSSGQGFIIHYVGYIWDSVSVHYRGMRVSSKRVPLYANHDSWINITLTSCLCNLY